MTLEGIINAFLNQRYGYKTIQIDVFDTQVKKKLSYPCTVNPDIYQEKKLIFQLQY